MNYIFTILNDQNVEIDKIQVSTNNINFIKNFSKNGHITFTELLNNINTEEGLFKVYNFLNQYLEKSINLSIGVNSSSQEEIMLLNIADFSSFFTLNFIGELNTHQDTKNEYIFIRSLEIG